MQTSIAVGILLTIIPIVGIVFGCSLLFFFFFWQHRRQMELIKRNQYLPPSYKHIKTLSLLMGILSVCTGMPVTTLLWVIDGLSYGLLGGLVPIFSGLGLILFAIMHQYDRTS